MFGRYCLAAAAAVASLSALAANELPKRKPGLWEIKTEMSVMGGQQMVMQQCIDEKTDANLLAEATRQQGQCDPPRIQRDGDRTVVDTTCKIRGGTARTHGVFSGRYDSSYQGEVLTTFDPPQQGMKEARMKIDARWQGPCPAGQQPGTARMKLPGLGNIDVQEMMKNMPGMGGRQ